MSPCASSWRTPAWRPRGLARSRGWVCGLRGSRGEGPDPREVCVSGQHNPTHDALLANDVVDLTGTCRSALEEEVGHGGDMMRPLRSGAKANAAGSALRLPLPSLKFGPCPRCVRVPFRPGQRPDAAVPADRRRHGEAALALLHHRRRGGWSPEGTKVPSGEYNRGLRARCPKSREPKEI
jgi:hypothetical protein